MASLRILENNDLKIGIRIEEGTEIKMDSESECDSKLDNAYAMFLVFKYRIYRDCPQCYLIEKECFPYLLYLQKLLTH